MKDPVGWRVLRWLFAGYYLYVGVSFALSFAGVIAPHPPKISPRSAAFQGALVNTGFVMPMLLASYIVAGLAMLFMRTAPLGLVLLAPSAVIIFFTDTLLDNAWVPGTLNGLVLLALAWHFRSAFERLWNCAPPNP